MTRDKLLLAKEYYSIFTPGSWVQVPRDGLLEGIAALKAAWGEREQLLIERASVVDWANTQLREHGLPEIESSRITEDLKFAIGLLSETAHKHAIERDQLKHRVRELESWEYICKKCGLRKDADAPSGADF